MTPLLQVQDLSVAYVNAKQVDTAVERVSFDIYPGEIVGFVGESGCGKSTLLQAVMRILPPPGFISGGKVLFQGQDLLQLSIEEMAQHRWRKASMVFQSAMNSLNPVLTVAEQFDDTLAAHGVGDLAHRRARTEELLNLVGIPPARANAYPHELSGGMRQRVGIALALIFEPQLVVMDEPTTALDVLVQSEILQEIKKLQKLGFAVCFVSHDLPVVAQFVRPRVNVFYAGHLVERSTTQNLLQKPQHPYTRALLRSFPSIHSATLSRGIPGAPPSIGAPPPGCRFHPRCNDRLRLCDRLVPELVTLGPAHQAACHLISDQLPASSPTGASSSSSSDVKK